MSKFPCLLCSSQFARSDNLLKHVKKYHGPSEAEKISQSRKRQRQGANAIRDQVAKRRREEMDNGRKRRQEEIENGSLSFNFKRDMARGASFCKVCNRMFNDAEECKKHEVGHEISANHSCKTCKKKFKTITNKRYHEQWCGKTRNNSTQAREKSEDDDEEDEESFEEVESAFDNVARVLRLNFASGIRNLHTRFGRAIIEAGETLQSLQRSDHSLRYFVSLRCRFYKPTDPDTITDIPPVFNSESCTLLPVTSIQTQMEVNYNNILHAIEGYERNGKEHFILFCFHVVDYYICSLFFSC